MSTCFESSSILELVFENDSLSTSHLWFNIFFTSTINNF